MARGKALGSFCLLLGALLGCTDESDYSTLPGECYLGTIVDAEFIRSSTLPAGTELRLRLDVDALASGGSGTAITTSDESFRSSPVRQVRQLSYDTLSLLQFPSGRMRNFLAYSQAADGGFATVVISLMENEDVEVRIIRPDSSPEDDVDDSMFGLFRLLRAESCVTGAR